MKSSAPSQKRRLLLQKAASRATYRSWTGREQEILALLAHGASNREISETLFIAGGTVKNHLSNILSKLGVRDRTQAALKARELGLM